MVSCCGTWIIADKREVETVESGHRETIEEVLDMKRKLTSVCCGSWWRVGELKRERRMQFESKYWGGCLLIYPFVCLFTRLLIYPFVCLFVYSFTHLPFCLFVCLFVLKQIRCVFVSLERVSAFPSPRLVRLNSTCQPLSASHDSIHQLIPSFQPIAFPPPPPHLLLTHRQVYH